MINKFINATLDIIGFILKLAFVSAAFCVFGFVGFHLLISANVINPGIRVGQVWKTTGRYSDDPFREPYPTRRVIAIQDGYVQFVDSDGDTSSRTMSGFYYYGELSNKKAKTIPTAIYIIGRPYDNR